MTSALKCRQPGCSGVIVDGYCNVCGMPPGSQPVQRTDPAHPRPTNPAPARERQHVSRDKLGVRAGACLQPGCTGVIVDGYCNVCGQPPVVVEQANVLGTQVQRHSNSAELGMVALGSALVEPGSSAKPRAASLRSRTRIGAGITTVPPAPPMDPATAIMSEPVVPQQRRNCANCAQPVGRSTPQDPGGLTHGTCTNCGTPFDFRPTIAPGEIISGQYEVAGALAYGGMGWLYLARDRNVSDRWVVLKGLLNENDEDASAAAKMEKEFLAQVESPLIVEIYNFVQHDDARYIVMEYVPGRSITDLLKQRREANDGVMDPLPVDWALAYLIEVAPAFSYLHANQLLYCDFKPDNLMQVADSVKLIDLGAVRRMDDDTSPIFGTVGYQAPEVAELGCSVASDVYTLGRALVVMCADFRGYQSEYATSLPAARELAVFDAQDSLYRLVQRACAPVREDRFQSAEEFRLQATGVLREVVGREAGGAALISQVSTLFTAPTLLGETNVDWRSLPQLKADGTDPMHEWLTALPQDRPKERLAALEKAPTRTPAVILAQVDLALQLGDLRYVAKLTSELLKQDPWEWRAVWVQGIAQVQAGSWHNAVAAFNTVYSQVPGELAPKFALAVACERAGKSGIAEELFAVCASTDASYVTASAFALARLRQARGDYQLTLDALALVPPTSRGYAEARQLRAGLLLQRGKTMADLSGALDSVRSANLDPAATACFEVQILQRALHMVQQSGPQPRYRIGGAQATEHNIRPQLEQAYRKQAAWSQDVEERNRLISNADTTRRWSLF